MRAKTARKGRKKVTGALQENILTLLCFDTEACPPIIAAVDTELFESKIYRNIADRAITYFRKYKSAAGDHLPDLLEEFLQSTKRAEVRLYTDALNDLFRTHDGINREYILDELQAFVRQQSLRQSITLAAEELQAGNVDKAESVLAKGLDSIGRPALGALTVRCSADIEPRNLSPLWPDVLYLRKVSLCAGDPGLGKSMMTCDVAARVSCGSDWPGGEPAVIGPSNVLMLSGEDDQDDTIVPRLIAAGADRSNIHILNDVVEKQDGELSVLSLDQHMPEIHKEMLRHKAVLLVIDPISAFMGGRDSHNNTAVRALLNKLRQYAFEGEYAVLLITHFNKPGEKVSSAIHRVMGSLGFIAAARSAHAFVLDPDDPHHRLFLPIKNNLGPDTEGFRCHIVIDRSQKLSPPPAYLKWDAKPVSGQRVDEVLTQASPRAQAQKAKEQEIKEWLDGYMKRGKRMLSTEFNEEIKRRNYTERKVRNLMARLGYKKEKKGFGSKAAWWVIRERRKVN